MFYALIGLYLAILLFIGYRVSHNETVRDFFVANRKLSMWSAGISLSASWIDASFIFLAITLGYLTHWNTGWFLIAACAEFLMFGIFAKKFKRLTEETDSISYLDLIYKKLGKNIGLLSSFGIAITFLLWIALQYFLGAELLKTIFNFPFNTSLMIMSVFTVSYLVLGGFKASIKTDVFQFLLILLLMVSLCLFWPSLEANQTIKTIRFLEDGQTVKHLFEILLFMFAAMFSADALIRVMASKNEKHAAGTIGISLIIFLCSFSFFGYIGYELFRYLPNLTAEELPKAFMDNFVDAKIYPIIIVSFLAAMMSSIDTYTFTAGQALMNDGLMRLNFFKRYSERKMLRCSVVIVTLLSIAISLLVSSLMSFFIIVMGFLGCGAPVFLSLMTGKSQNKKAIFLTVSLALSIHIVLFLLGNLNEYTSVITNASITVLWWLLETYGKKS